jgi:acetyl esterase/lipase
MKKILLLLAFSIIGCSDKNDNEPQAAETLLNVSYGADPIQKIDIYLPAGRSESSTEVLFLVHGGAWSEGSKDDLTPSIPQFRFNFPDYAIVNVGYRLGTPESPGYPKQIDDIEAMIAFMESHSDEYNVSDDYAFLGASAGAHLSMLYAYGFDEDHDVKAVVSLVGPTDFNDPAYTENELFQGALVNLVGPNPPENLYTEVSPIAHVDAQSPPTIQFLGNADPLVPVSQGQRLKAALDNAGVANDLRIYDAGHGDFNQTDAAQINTSLTNFINGHMN